MERFFYTTSLHRKFYSKQPRKFPKIKHSPCVGKLKNGIISITTNSFFFSFFTL
jgi:hypothetical protein